MRVEQKGLQPRPAKQNHPALSPFTTCSNCMARLVVLYFMNLPLQCLVLHAYEELLKRNRTVLYCIVMFTAKIGCKAKKTPSANT